MNKKILIKRMFVFLIVGLFLINLVYANNTKNLIKNKDYIKDLREVDTLIVDGHLTKEYKANEKRLIITGEKKWWDLLGIWTENSLLDIRLVSDYVVSGLIASNDTMVAELLLVDWDKNANLFDSVNYYDIKNQYNIVSFRCRNSDIGRTQNGFYTSNT